MFTVNVNESLYRSGSLEINRIRAVLKGKKLQSRSKVQVQIFLANVSIFLLS